MCVQEIKFEPNVMCEHIDKKSTFKASQVSTVIIQLLYLDSFHVEIVIGEG